MNIEYTDSKEGKFVSAKGIIKVLETVPEEITKEELKDYLITFLRTLPDIKEDEE